jgi:hypothetical protein
MLGPMVPERRPILRLLVPDEKGYGEADLSQRVMLNAAGRRSERRDCERENYASNGNALFRNRYLLGMSHRGNLKGVPSISEPPQIGLENCQFQTRSNLLLFPKRSSRIWMVSSMGTWIAHFSRLSNSDECCSATIRITQSVRSQQTSRRSLPTRDRAGVSQWFAAQFRKRLERLGTIMKGQRQERLALDLVLRGWTRTLARPSC